MRACVRKSVCVCVRVCHTWMILPTHLNEPIDASQDTVRHTSIHLLNTYESGIAPLVPRGFDPACWGLNQPSPSPPQYTFWIPFNKPQNTFSVRWCRSGHEVATIRRLLKIICLFGKRDLQKRRYSAKKTCNFKEPTNRSHPIPFDTLWSRYLLTYTSDLLS